MVCMFQIKHRQHALEHAVCVAPIPQLVLHHTDQGYICPERASSCSWRIDNYLSDVWSLPIYLQYDSVLLPWSTVVTTTATTTTTTTTTPTITTSTSTSTTTTATTTSTTTTTINTLLLGAHTPNEGDGWMMHDINVKAYQTHETNTLPITDYMTNEEEHQALRRYYDILKDRSLYKMLGDRWSTFRQRRSSREH